MNILIQVPDNVHEDIYTEISAMLKVVTKHKPKTELFTHPELKGDYEVIKREAGAIDYTIKVTCK